MSHVLKYDGHYFRIEIGEVASVQPPDREYVEYVAWCSDAFKELPDLPRQALSRFVAGPFPTYAEALRQAQDWIKSDWDTLRTRTVDEPVGFMYTVWLFKRGASPSTYAFNEFADARSFAKAAESCVEITKVGITDRESPQYLAVWERAT